MITLYDSKETNFTNNGITPLSDCKSCYNEEKLNDIYENTLEYPIDDRGKWKYLINGNIIKSDGQLFRIYHKVKTLSGIVVNARHIFYDNLNNFLEDVRPTNLNGAGALNWILSNTQYTHNFISMSDIDHIDTEYFVRKNPVDAIMGEDGVISRWGGELVRDNFTIKLLQARGLDRGVLISYGKNIIGIEETLDMDSVCTRLMPVGANGLLLSEKYIDSPLINNYAYPIVKTMDFADAATEADLLAAGSAYMNSGADKPLSNYVITFLELTKTEEYKNYSVLETVYMGDTVTVRHTKLDMDLKCEVIRIKKNILTGRIEEVELGNFKPNLATTLNSYSSVVNAINNITDSNGNLSPSAITMAIQNATNLLISSNDGHVVQDENGISIMDTTDKNTAVKVWRFNLNGLGYSSTGYNGPFGIAITSDGHIVADYITSGALDASLLKVGTIASTDGTFSIGIGSGVMTINNSKGTAVIQEGKITYESYCDFNRGNWALKADFTASGVDEPRFYPAKFGLGLLFEKPVSNEMLYGDCETTVPYLNASGNNSFISCTNTISASVGIYGTHSVQYYKNANAGGYYQSIATTPANYSSYVYTFSAYIFVPSNQGFALADISLQLFDHTSAGGYASNTSGHPTAFDCWQRLSVTRTNRASLDSFFVRICENNGVSGKSFYYDAIQLEQNTYASTFIDGTHARDNCTIPTPDLLDATVGTIEFNLTRNSDGVTEHNDMLWGNAGADGFLMRTSATIGWQFEYYVGSATYDLNFATKLVTGQSYHIAVKWDSSGCALFIDNVKIASDSHLFTPPSVQYLQLGGRGEYSPTAGIIDNLKFSSRARTDAELTSYNLSLPAIQDDDTTGIFAFDGDLSYLVQDYGIKTTHEDGSYTVLSGSGYSKYIDGIKKPYHCLSYQGLLYLTGSGITVQTSTIDIPDEFLGAEWTISGSLMCYSVNAASTNVSCSAERLANNNTQFLVQASMVVSGAWSITISYLILA